MASGESEKAVKSQRFTCSECAAELEYDAASGKLKCGHCGAAREVPTGTGTIVEYDFFQGLEQAPMPDEVLSDGFAISARPIGTHAVLVEILIAGLHRH